MLHAGFAVRDITPPPASHIPGGFAPRPATGVHDPLQVRAAVIRGTTTVALVAVDAVGVTAETVAAAREGIAAECGIPPRQVTVAASHTHCGGPSFTVLGTDADPDYCSSIAATIVAAVVEAQASARPCQLAAVSGQCDGWAFCRRFVMHDGRHATNPKKGDPEVVKETAPTDPEVGLLAFADDAGKLLGCIANFACHVTVMGGSEFSADYPAQWELALRQRAPEAVLVFVNGACGDINQVNWRQPGRTEFGPEHAAAMGAALAEATWAALDQATWLTADDRVATAHGEAVVQYRPLTAEALAEAERIVAAATEPWPSTAWLARDLLLLAEQLAGATEVACPVDVYRIGPGLVAAAPWQPFCEFGLTIKGAGGGSPILVAAFANGQVGYVPTEAGFIGGGYEPTHCRGSKLTPSAGDLITAETIRLLRQLA